MAQLSPASTLDAQLKAASEIADAIVAVLTNERGAHAETVIVAAARMAGTFLFHSFNLPTRNLSPGTPVFSDAANERGPLLVEVLESGLKGLDVEISKPVALAEPGEGHSAQLTLSQTQIALEPGLTKITSAHGLSGEAAARACALAAALLIYRTRSVLDPTIGFGLAVYGFVEGTKTVPARSLHVR
ncbi:MAG: hypothetical protein ABI679_07200 [Gemmatimonadota bacterium]